MATTLKSTALPQAPPLAHHIPPPSDTATLEHLSHRIAYLLHRGLYTHPLLQTHVSPTLHTTWDDIDAGATRDQFFASIEAAKTLFSTYVSEMEVLNVCAGVHGKEMGRACQKATAWVTMVDKAPPIMFSADLLREAVVKMSWWRKGEGGPWVCVRMVGVRGSAFLHA